MDKTSEDVIPPLWKLRQKMITCKPWLRARLFK